MLNLKPDADRIDHLIAAHDMRLLSPANLVPPRVEIDGKEVSEAKFITACCDAGLLCFEVFARLPRTVPDIPELEGPPQEIGTGLYRMVDGEIYGNEPDPIEF